jgi:hypothetical protein
MHMPLAACTEERKDTPSNTETPSRQVFAAQTVLDIGEQSGNAWQRALCQHCITDTMTLSSITYSFAHRCASYLTIRAEWYTHGQNTA